MTGKTLAHYQVQQKIGAGGMGEVYRARDTKLGRDVALKILPEIFSQDADRMRRFQREAQVLASLNHPNIAAIYGLEERALVMELVAGPTLAERVAAGPMPLEEALPVASQIAGALEYAHEHGIIHRDLKPANVKVTPEGKVKVLDFGLAKALDDAPAPAGSGSESPTMTLGATRAGVILGTAAYMAPEQAKGKPVDRRADIWSFGVVLYEMLTGRQMYKGETAAETLALVMTRETSLEALPAATPEAVRRLLGRCLDKDPKRRLRDIGEARILLEEPERMSPPVGPAVPAPPPRRPLAWIAPAVLGVGLLGVSAVHFRENPPPEPQVFRFHIPIPEKMVLGNGFSLSPDGRRLAFNALGPDGRMLVWIRPLDALEARALPGTEGVDFCSGRTTAASLLIGPTEN